ncbi:MAG: hypothetical protein QXP77_00115 [Candidatus Aenigmatarchaeota archaeon]
MSLAKKIGGIALIGFSLFPFFGFPAPKEIAFLADLPTRIVFTFIGLYCMGLLSKEDVVRDIVALGMFLISLGFVLPVSSAHRIILFLYSLDLVSFLPIPIIGKIIGRILLLAFLFFLSSFGLAGLLQVNLGLAIVLVVFLSIIEIIAFIFGSGHILAVIKAILVGCAALFAPTLFGTSMDIATAVILGGGIFILNLIFQ